MDDYACNHRNGLPQDLPTAIVPRAPVVMVAGPFGSGVEEFGALLAERLHLPLYNPNKLDHLARDREKHEHLKQRLGHFFDHWLDHLHGAPGAGRQEHMRTLLRILEQVAGEGGVIIGVCIHHMMPGEKLFRIRVNASVNHCAHRLAQSRHCSYLESVAAFYHMEDEHALFLKSLFENSDIEPIDYDLELDAERLTPAMMLEAALAAMDSRHFPKEAA